MNEEASTVETTQGVQQALALNWIQHISHVENLIPVVEAILSNESFTLLLRVIVGAILNERAARTCEYVASCKVVHEGGLLDQCAQLIRNAIAEDVGLAVGFAQQLASPYTVVNVSSHRKELASRPPRCRYWEYILQR